MFLRNAAFVGGCITGLLITDEVTKQQVRATDDVDLIVDVMNYAAYARLSEQLRKRGFKESVQDNIVCRWRLGELIVDVMPTDEKILGFSNSWYKPALNSAVTYALKSGRLIRIVSPPYFLAMKIEAFKGRGNNDYLSSRDIEDIVTLVDGREELGGEVAAIGDNLQTYIAASIREFLSQRNFEYAVQSAVRSDTAREEVIFRRFELLAKA